MSTASSPRILAAAGLLLIAGSSLAGCATAAEPAADPTESVPASPSRTRSAAKPSPTAADPTGPVVGADANTRSTEVGVVEKVVDGDTVKVAGVGSVRLIGIDTPERGQCGFGPATSLMKRLVLGKQVTLVSPSSTEDHDRYDRKLRYVDVAGVDAGLAEIRAGLARARYDSRDGYGAHPREAEYVAADAVSPSTC